MFSGEPVNMGQAVSEQQQEDSQQKRDSPQVTAIKGKLLIDLKTNHLHLLLSFSQDNDTASTAGSIVQPKNKDR